MVTATMMSWVVYVEMKFVKSEILRQICTHTHTHTHTHEGLSRVVCCCVGAARSRVQGAWSGAGFHQWEVICRNQNITRDYLNPKCRIL